MKRRFVMQAAAALVLIWTGVWVVTRLAAASVPTPERLLAYVRTGPLESGPRDEVLKRVTADYARLPFLGRRALRAPEANGDFVTFLSQLTPAEKARFVDQALPAGFRQLLDGFAKMPANDRVKTLERSKRELLEHLGESPARTAMEAASPELIRQISTKGLGPFFDALPPDARLQLLPMIEQMQNNMRQLRD